MPAVAITVPGVGESITEGIVALAEARRRAVKARRAALRAGDRQGDARRAGAVGRACCKIAVAEGATVAIGAVIGTIDPAARRAARGRRGRQAR